MGAEGKGARGAGGEFVPFAAALSHHQSFFSRRRLVKKKGQSDYGDLIVSENLWNSGEMQNGSVGSVPFKPQGARPV